MASMPDSKATETESLGDAPAFENEVSKVFSPVIILLSVIICFLLYKIYCKFINSSADPVVLPKLRKDMTVAELRQYDGTQPDGRVLVAVNGWIFDATRGRRFYGPGGPYAAFGGKDASRGLATFVVTSSDKEYDDLSDLNSMEMESVKEWEAQFRDGFSNLQDMFDLEKDLPDELMGGSWAEQPGVPGSKPPAQGPGPGNQLVPQQQLNGDDPTAAMQRQINNHLIQQVFSQGNKGGLVGHNNPLGLSSLGSKSPNLQSPPNVSVSKDLMGGMHPQLMPNTSHPNQLHSTMPMSSIQGGMNVQNVGNMIVTNSNMTGAGMLGSGIINNVNKQLPTLMGNHHGTPQHHPHAQAMQNGPLGGRVGVGMQAPTMRSTLQHHPRMQAPGGGGHPLAPYHPTYGQSAQGPGVPPAQRAAGVRFGPPGEAGGGAAQAVPPAPSPQTPGAPAGGQSQPQAATQAAAPHVHQPHAPHQAPATGSIADPEKRKLIQQQLVLLQHAHMCQRRESQSNGEPWQCTLPHCKTMKGVLNHMMSCQAGKNCAVPDCSSSRQIINHWKHCNKNDCPVCLPLKQADRTRPNNMNAAAVSHTATGVSTGVAVGNVSVGGVGVGNVGVGVGVGVGNAGGSMVNSLATAPAPAPSTQGADMKRAYEALGIACPTSVSNMTGGFPRAQPTRMAVPRPPGLTDVVPQQQSAPMQQLFAQQNQPDLQQQQLMGGSTLQLPGGPVTANAVTGTKEWHQSITADLRNHLVHKLVQAIFPTPDPHAMLDKRMHNLVAYAREVEGDMYEMASTRSEYYHLLAEKIYKIQKELEEKRQKRKEQQLQMPQTPNGGSVGVGNPGMSPFAQTMTSPASYPALQSNGPALASPGPLSDKRLGAPVPSPFVNHSFREPAASPAPGTPHTPLAHPSPAPDARPASRPPPAPPAPPPQPPATEEEPTPEQQQQRPATPQQQGSQPMHQKALQQLMATLRSPTTHNQQQEILQILKSNPPLMAAFIKQRQNAQNQQAAAGGVGGVGAVGGVGSVCGVGVGGVGLGAGVPQQQQPQMQHPGSHGDRDQL